MPTCSCISTFMDTNYSFGLIVSTLPQQTLIHACLFLRLNVYILHHPSIFVYLHIPSDFSSLGHKHRHKRHKFKRRQVAGVPTVSNTAPVVSAGIFSDVESLSASLVRDPLLRSSESGSTSARPSNDSSGDSGPHRRSKRFLSYPRFVEVMLVADSKMVEHHGSNLQHYILTLMSIVSFLLLCQMSLWLQGEDVWLWAGR